MWESVEDWPLATLESSEIFEYFGGCIFPWEGQKIRLRVDSAFADKNERDEAKAFGDL